MKKIYNLLVITAFISAIFWSCNDSEDIITGNAQEGGLVEVSTSANAYVVGNPGPYTMEFFVHQDGSHQIEKIELYKSFTGTDLVTGTDGEDSVVSYVSNEVLDRTLDVSENGDYFITSDYMLSELVSGLTAKGGALPTNDAELRIGDKFQFRTLAYLDNGRIVEQSYNINFTVSTRYAGTYRYLDGEYWRLGVLNSTSASWPDELVIESVDATTYKAVEYIGPFDGNEWYFQIIDGKISFPDKTPDGTAQSLNGQPLITCASNPNDMTNVKCGDTNVVINDDATGKDRLRLSVGYYTGGSGSREFFMFLEKVVK